MKPRTVDFRQLKQDGATATGSSIDLTDVLDAIDIPIVVVSCAFTIDGFNHAAAEIFHLRPSDFGRSPCNTPILSALTELKTWCAQVVANETAQRHDFRSGETFFVVRIAPYKKSHLSIGTIVTFTNVTAFRASIEQAIYEREFTKTVLNTVPNALAVLSADYLVQTGNRAFYEMFGIPREQIHTVPIWELANSFFDQPQLRLQLEEVRKSDHAFTPFHVEHDSPIMGHRTIEVDIRVFSASRQAESMILLGFHDITAIKRAETASAYLASIVEFSDDAIVTKSLAGVITSWNDGAKRMFGYAAEEVIGKSVSILIPKENSDETRAILERIRRGERVDPYETVRMRKDGSLIDISLSVSPVKDSSGKLIGASKIARDNTKKKKAEAELRLVLAELQHRVKNTLSVVQSIAIHTLHSASAAEQSAFIARLHALAGAHDALVRHNWQHAPLSDIVDVALEPFQRERITSGGPHVQLKPTTSVLLSMVLHELATNAVKHGALSNDVGQVHIHWTLGEKNGDTLQLMLRWEERGGPLVHVPTRKGLGSRLIEGSLRDAQIEFAPEGASYTLRLDL